MHHSIIALVEDKPGVLNRVASLFRRRAFNIESLTVGRTDVPGISRMTVVIDSDQVSAERVTAYLYKLVNVLQVEDLRDVPAVARDLALVKVAVAGHDRAQLLRVVDDAALEGFEKPRLKALLEHFAAIEDPREPWRVAHPLPEVLLLVVCGTICDCDDYDLIADWGAAHLDFLRRYLPYHHGVPGGRWLTILMNRIDPACSRPPSPAWVRETWPDRPDFVAIDGKTSRRSHDRSAGKAPLHLVSAFATTSRLVLGQEAVADKSSETTAIPLLVERLAANDGLKGALVSIDAIATNAAIATTIRNAGADYLLAVKANQPTLRSRDRTLLRRCPAPTASTPSSISTRRMAASRSAPSPSAARPTGSKASAAFPANCACQTPQPSSASVRAPD